MSTTKRMLIGITSLVLSLAAAWLSGTAALQQNPSADIEAEIHLGPGAAKPGKPAVARKKNHGMLRLKVVNVQTGKPVFCRVNVVGADGNYYEPGENPLAPWSLQRLGNRRDKGPVRYYGWFFYSNGDCETALPPGQARVEVWKGFEYEPAAARVEITRGKTAELTVKIGRTVDMAARGWYSGDTHIHLNRTSELDNQRALDLAAAEDIRFAHILCMNDPRRYSPVMGQQIWHQNFGLGKKSEKFRGIYGIASGQEYRCGTFGHICLVGGTRLVQADGMKTDPNNWPVFGLVADELRGIGGYSFHAHGGYEKEIYADFAQRATDGVELLQFAVYRGIRLEGWYHILNAGFRFPAVAASDYPYCRALGDCRTYVYLGDRPRTFDSWNRAAAGGRSFMTTGPLLEVSVNGNGPGDTLTLPAGKHVLNVDIELNSLVGRVDEIHVIEGGRIRARLKPPKAETIAAAKSKESLRYSTTVRIAVTEPTWIAVRAFAKSGSNRENVEAHTNPVYAYIGGKPPFRPESARWLLKKIDERIAFHQGRSFAEKHKVLAYFRKSRGVLAGLLKKPQVGQSPDAVQN